MQAKLLLAKCRAASREVEEIVYSFGKPKVQRKLLPYLALSGSATDPWTDFDIDRAIVIPDWEGEVEADWLYIKPDYTTERGWRTVLINHVDGCGMMLPSVSPKNFMFRGPYFKGLLSVFNFLEFCKVHNVPPVIKDVWGKEHDLVKEDIRIIFTASQLKLWKYYDDWDHYKREFKKNGCQFGTTNNEEEYNPDKDANYQMLQTLQDFTDEEIKAYTAKTHEKIRGIAQDKTAMLRTLKADKRSYSAYQKALYMYNELLRDGYSRQQLKDIKKRMLMDAKSGAIRCANKRLFVVPDWYACCEHYFLHIPKPRGLVKPDEVVCRPYRGKDKIDVLRSPH